MTSSACSIFGSSTLSTETLPGWWKTTAFIIKESFEVGTHLCAAEQFSLHCPMSRLGLPIGENNTGCSFQVAMLHELFILLLVFG
jgi:hypothetical protein